NPAGSQEETPRPVKTDGKPVLRWEFWDGVAWIEMGTSTTTGWQPAVPDIFKFGDDTGALTREGAVFFRLPKEVVAATVNGVENFWIRARLISGHYGEEARYVKRERDFEFFEATFAPPIIKSLKVDYNLALNEAPEAVLTFNDFRYDDATPMVNLPGKSILPFRQMEDEKPTFYLGFTLPQDRAEFPRRKVSLYCRAADIRYGEKTVPLAPDLSEKIGAIGSTVSHFFTLTNDSAISVSFTLRIIGSRWPSVIVDPTPILIDAGKTKEVEVQVTVPGGASSGESDSGFIEVESSAEAGFERAAAFTTFAEADTGARLRLIWEYWDGQEWSKLTVRDDTENFTRPELIEFLAPPDFAPRREFDLLPRYWLRVRWEEGRYDFAPRLRRALINTTLAAQTVTVRNEILGSSDGSANQRFRAARAPVLTGQRLEAREVETPSAAELDKLAREEGVDMEQAVTIIRDATGRPREIWVRWHEVSDFYGSGPRDRHYVLDHLTGEIRFGDGLRGLIPPSGAGNLRLARYQTGGGSAGNRAANTIVQLKTSVPYVDKVTNAEAAEGGADSESLDSLLTRMPREIRHRRRAVTVEDYEDLALIASPAVARSRAVPLRNLAVDPLGKGATVLGEVSVIIVPRSTEAKPLPSIELLNRVQDYLEARIVPTASVFVVGPLYIRVDVTAEIALLSLEGASAVEQAVEQTLAAFLHPLTGGLEGEGWDFGRKPHRSDLFALIESVEGVDHIRALTIKEIEDQPGVSATDRFLVYSGTHTIRLVFD
ncbi:MAG: putative baseplate assembly protein, partial [Acidobacteriota bacterium]